MSGQSRSWLPVLVLLGFALLAGLAAGSADNEWALPSIDNPGPHGLKVLAVWLQESGVEVRAHKSSLENLDAAVKTLVIAGPRARQISDEELKAVQAFVKKGNTLIYMDPRGADQSAMSKWLNLKPGPFTPLTEAKALEDISGATIPVRVHVALTEGVDNLRVTADLTTKPDLDKAIDMTDRSALWLLPFDDGAVWVTEGTEIAENSRLELLDNLKFWKNVGARGPVAFDEYHHVPATPVAVPPNLTATLLQGLVCVLVFLAAFGQRLGPARPTLVVKHRSSMEYVNAMANLTENAGLESSLVQALQKDVRLQLQERLGISTALPVGDAAAAFTQRTRGSADDLLGLFGDTTFLQASQRAARISRTLAGRS